jgi:hypothetical protein
LLILLKARHEEFLFRRNECNHLILTAYEVLQMGRIINNKRFEYEVWLGSNLGPPEACYPIEQTVKHSYFQTIYILLPGVCLD